LFQAVILVPGALLVCSTTASAQDFKTVRLLKPQSNGVRPLMQVSNDRKSTRLCSQRRTSALWGIAPGDESRINTGLRSYGVLYNLLMRSLNRLHRIADFSTNAGLHFGGNHMGSPCESWIPAFAGMTMLGLGLRKTVTPAKAGVQRLLAFPSIIHSRKSRPPRLPWLSGSKLGSAVKLLTSVSCNLLCAPSNIKDGPYE